MSRRPRAQAYLRVDSLGTVVEIRTNDSDFGEDVAGLFVHFPSSSDDPDHVFTVARNPDRYSLFRDDDRLEVDVRRDEVLLDLLVAINEATILGLRSFVVHAGVVTRDGVVIAFPADKRAGKSTIVAALLQRGFDYVTDEALVLGDGDQITPYPKALWLTHTSRKALDLNDGDLRTTVSNKFKSPVMPGELGAEVATSQELIVSHVVVLDRSGESARIEAVPESEVAYQLIHHSFNRDANPREWVHTAGRMARSSIGLRLSYGEIREAAETVEAYTEVFRA